MKEIAPVIQNAYLANKKLTTNDILFLIQAMWRGDVKWSDLKTKRHTLIKLLETEGFTLDESETKNSTALRYDAQGVEAYLSPNGRGSIRLTIVAGKAEFGVHPDYLDELLKVIEMAGFRLAEIDGARMVYTRGQYNWQTPYGRAMLAGAKPKY